MFLESQIEHPMQKGSIEVICGSMFSGKTEELLRRLKRAKYAKLKIKIFKPKIDTRFDKEKVFLFRATRPIALGEELFLDYGSNYNYSDAGFKYSDD